MNRSVFFKQQSFFVVYMDVYMDDVLSGAATIEKTKELQQQLIGLCMAGGLPLRKWSANDHLLLKDIPEHRMQREPRAWQPHETHSTLGLQWHPATDEFSFTTRTISKANFSEWYSLSQLSYSILGWLAPAIVRAKIAFQSTWLQGLDWDTPPTSILLDNGRTSRKSFLYLRKFEFLVGSV